MIMEGGHNRHSSMQTGDKKRTMIPPGTNNSALHQKLVTNDYKKPTRGGDSIEVNTASRDDDDDDPLLDASAMRSVP